MNRFRKTLQSTQAAIDLASIMVGIIVIGIIGGVIGATVFAVIPWAQDNAAKEELRAVKQAQAVYAALASTGDVVASGAQISGLAFIDPFRMATNSTVAAEATPANFASYDTLVNNKLLKRSDTIGLGLGTDKKCYAITAYSNTGKIFWLESLTGNINSYSSTSVSACAGVSLVDILPEASKGKPVAETPTPTTPPTTEPTAPPATTPPATTEPTTPPVITTPVTTKTTKMSVRCDNTSTFNLNLTGFTGKITWSDGVTNNYTNSGLIQRTNVNKGQDYVVTLEGTYTKLGAGGTIPTNACLRSLDVWGSETGVTSISGAFVDATNLGFVAAPPKTVTDMSYAFARSNYNDAGISNWDLSNVTTINNMFNGAAAFNQPLNNWNVSNVTNMGQAFVGAKLFNQPLNKWNTTNVTSMVLMFQNTTQFNQDISGWDVKKVTNYASFRSGSGLTAANAPKFV